jgi:hypothetical protein
MERIDFEAGVVLEFSTAFVVEEDGELQTKVERRVSLNTRGFGLCRVLGSIGLQSACLNVLPETINLQGVCFEIISRCVGELEGLRCGLFFPSSLAALWRGLQCMLLTIELLIHTLVNSKLVLAPLDPSGLTNDMFSLFFGLLLMFESLELSRMQFVVELDHIVLDRP